MINESKKFVKLVIQETEETVDFVDFLDEVLDFEEIEKRGVNKGPYENGANFRKRIKE